MSNGEFARINYYRGQMLTARDFQDQQEYHRGKQKLLLRRFPPGIIGGLVVTCQPKGSDPDDFEAFLIGEGLAVDPEGNEIVVPEAGLKVPIEEFKPEAPYLSLYYDESAELVGDDSCSSNQKNNRIREQVKHEWDSAPNMGLHITVALIQLKDIKDPGTSCDKYNDPMKPVVNVGDPPIRKNARVVDTDQITDGAITDRKIRIGAVTTEKLAQSAVTTDKILNEAVTDTKLANNAVTTNKLQNGAVNTDKLTNDSVSTDKIQNGAVTEDKLAPDAVTEARIADGAVTEHKLADDSVSTDKIQNGAVIEAKLDNNAVAREKIQNGAVNELKLDANSVIGAKIADGAVSALKLADDSVVTVKILNAAVTTDKLAPNAVIGTKIQNGAVTETKLASNAVSTDKIQGGAVNADKLANNAVVTDRILNGAVNADKIANQAVTSAKLKLIKTIYSGTLSPVDQNTNALPVTGPPPLSVSPNAILHVVPTNAGELSWSFSVKGGGADGRLFYSLKVVNTGSITVEYDVREILFN